MDKPQPHPIRREPRQWMRCSVCHGYVSLRDDGTLYPHTRSTGEASPVSPALRVSVECEGGGKRP
jgi:hypothetical protein